MGKLKLSIQPDYKEALKEYAAFEALLKKNGAKVHYFRKDAKVLIDSIYCRDASIATDFGMIICNMGKGGRINEPAAQAVDFLDKKIPIFRPNRSSWNFRRRRCGLVRSRNLSRGAYLQNQSKRD